MGALSVVSALSLLAAAHATPFERGDFKVIRHRSNALVPRAQQEPAVLPAAEFTVPITAKTPRRQSKKAALGLLRGKPTVKAARPGASSTVAVDGSDFDDEYLTNVTIGGQHFALIIDTGSSDTWVTHEGFNCFDIDGNPQPQATCAFGTAGFNPAASRTFKPFPNVSFNITYGDGEFLSGPVGFDTMTIGDVTVTQQELGFPTLAAWEGDGINTGLIGFAYGNLTSVFNTPDPTKASGENQLPYDPFFVSAVKQKKVSHPFFSVALDRGSFDQQENDPFDPNLGFLSFGGIAPVPVTGTSVTVPVEGYSLITFIPAPTGPDTAFFFYTVDVESFSFGSRGGRIVTRLGSNDTILDTGTTLNFVSTDVIQEYAAAFRPPATLDEDFDLYVVSCDAEVPPFSVTIGGKSFAIDARDQLLPAGTDDEGNIICVLGTQDGGPNVPENLFILGDTFLHNVVATFNPIGNEVTLTERQKY